MFKQTRLARAPTYLTRCILQGKHRGRVAPPGKGANRIWSRPRDSCWIRVKVLNFDHFDDKNDHFDQCD